MTTDQTERLHRAALLAIACNTMMLEVCDTLKTTGLYQQQRKVAINRLTLDLEQFMAKFYKGIGEEEEMQYMALVRAVESAAKGLASLTPDRIAMFGAVMDAFLKGEIFEANSDKAMTGLINRGQVKPVAGPTHPATGTHPWP